MVSIEYFLKKKTGSVERIKWGKGQRKDGMESKGDR